MPPPGRGLTFFAKGCAYLEDSYVTASHKLNADMPRQAAPINPTNHLFPKLCSPIAITMVKNIPNRVKTTKAGSEKSQEKLSLATKKYVECNMAAIAYMNKATAINRAIHIRLGLGPISSLP
jgi:hypothetical protein